MSPWFVYIIRCCDNTLYTGVTNELQARIDAHNTGKGSKYTRSRLPVILAWSRRCKSHGEALSLEYKIKRLKRSKKEALISGKSLE